MTHGRRRDQVVRQTVLMVLCLVCNTQLIASDFDVFDINEGELQFLTKPPAEPPHHHSTHVQITEESLKTGWVLNKQCHYDLGIVPALEIVFRQGKVRNLDVVRTENVGRAWVDRHTVQLEDVRKNAAVCIVAEIRSLKAGPAGGEWEWRGGPYLRRFLDGYFPMRVSLAIDYPVNRLKLDSLEPAAIRLRATDLPGHLRLNVLFEGRLIINAHFHQAAPGSGGSGSFSPFPF